MKKITLEQLADFSGANGLAIVYLSLAIYEILPKEKQDAFEKGLQDIMERQVKIGEELGVDFK